MLSVLSTLTSYRCTSSQCDSDNAELLLTICSVRLVAPAFDYHATSGHIERAYRAMWDVRLTQVTSRLHPLTGELNGTSACPELSDRTSTSRPSSRRARRCQWLLGWTPRHIVVDPRARHLSLRSPRSSMDTLLRRSTTELSAAVNALVAQEATATMDVFSTASALQYIWGGQLPAARLLAAVMAVARCELDQKRAPWRCDVPCDAGLIDIRASVETMTREGDVSRNSEGSGSGSGSGSELAESLLRLSLTVLPGTLPQQLESEALQWCGAVLAAESSARSLAPDVFSNHTGTDTSESAFTATTSHLDTEHALPSTSLNVSWFVLSARLLAAHQVDLALVAQWNAVIVGHNQRRPNQHNSGVSVARLIAGSRPAGKIVIAFYCDEYGQSWWPHWGPWLNGSGLGGSEEALIAVAEQLAAFDDVHVEVYNDPLAEHVGEHRHVWWYPVSWYDGEAAAPDVFVAWRYPVSLAVSGGARVRYVWLHDVSDALSSCVFAVNLPGCFVTAVLPIPCCCRFVARC